jgi:hypothetical protein
MNKIKWLATASVLIIGCAAVLIRAQHPLQKPGSSALELSNPIHISSNATGIASCPLGTSIPVGARLVCVTKITNAPTGGTGQLLDVYFQQSADDGQTWNDFAHAQFTAATTNYIPVSVIAGATSAITAIQDGSLGAGVVSQGPIGRMLRIKFSSAIGTSTGPWIFHPMVLVD